MYGPYQDVEPSQQDLGSQDDVSGNTEFGPHYEAHSDRSKKGESVDGSSSKDDVDNSIDK